MEFIKTEDLENQLVKVLRNPNRPIMVYPNEILDKNLSLGAIGFYVLLQIYEQQSLDLNKLTELYDENTLNSYAKELVEANICNFEG